MKKVIALLLSLTLVATMLVACGTTTSTEEAATEETTEVAATEETTTVETATVKTGLAVISSIEKSASAGEEDGLAQVDSTVVAVLVDQDGKILACNIDAAQTKINFSAEGKITTDLSAATQSKQEMGAAYGLGAASGISKEWNEQVDALAAYVIGKTVDEVKGIAVTEEGVATDADLTSSVTIKIGGYIAAIEKAVANAQDLGATATDTLGLAVTTDVTGSADVTAEAAGVAEAYTFYSAVSTSADGKITSCILDASQGSVNFDATGTVTSDLTVAPPTKQELKDDYGMKAKSGIGKEWYEQANSFAAYVIGKTMDEVKGIALSEEGLAADADLISSVTVHIGPFIAIVEKAAANAAK